MSAPTPTARPSSAPAGLRAAVARRPLAAFLVLALGLGWVSLGIPIVVDVESTPFLVLMLLALLGAALLVTWAVDGGPGVRRLLARAFQWRFGLLRWAVVLLAIPLLTLALAAATGTLVEPENGWLPMVGWYLFNTLIFGALLANLWEELAWAGFLQTRLMARRGLLTAALLTAVPFALIHIPLYVADAATVPELLRNLALLFALAPVYRYLLGAHLLATAGSGLAVGVQHASWNAAGNLDAVDGDWQVVAAVVALTVLVATVHHLRWGGPPGGGRQDERAAAARWLVVRDDREQEVR